MNIKMVKIRKDAKLPIRASDEAIGYDVFSSKPLDKVNKEPIGNLPIEILPGASVLIGIGVKMAIPWHYEAQLRPRSGLANKYDIELSNSPGTIDPDFRGEAGALLRNRGDKPFTVKKNMRIAQLIFSRVEIPEIEEVSDLSLTVRGEGGFGSTGLFGVGLGTGQFQKMIQEQDEYYMRMTLAAAENSRCIRGVKIIGGKCEYDEKGKLVGQTRKFGCLIVSKADNITAHGYNAQFPGSPKCEDLGCLRTELGIPSGKQLDQCRAMHAEWWAITNLSRSGGATGTLGATMYLNGEPCEVCAKIITGLGIDTMVLLTGVYPTNGTQIIRDAGINVRYVKM